MALNQRRVYYILSAIAASVIGILLHFLYDLFEGVISAIFSATNESVFEHLKLLFWPILAFMLINELIFRSRSFEKQTLFLLLSMALTIVLYYTYTGILGFSVTAIDILIYFISVTAFFLLSFLYERQAHEITKFAGAVSPIIIIVMITLMIAFTFNPPEIGLFQDPITGNYGL